MKFAIIAAGEGSRLAGEGVAKPKPMVELHGVPIIERLIRIFERNGADSISIIVNEQQPGTAGFLKGIETSCPLEIIVKSTPSSMHSMHALSPFLRGDKFCLTTVDTLFHEEEFERYIQALKESDGDGIMAVTDYIDDEKPLYVATDGDLGITGFHDSPNADTRYISGGIYGLTPKALDILDSCMADGIHRMRNFQRRLVESGMKLKAFPLGKIIDIDHAEDIAKAEEFLKER
jgi:NDP-sugar pyrophosphorylase family protein